MSRSRSPSTSAISALMAPDSVCSTWLSKRQPPGVLHPARLALVVAELRDRQVEVAVPVEIAGAHVRHPRHLIDQHARREGLTAVVLEHDHGADLRVVREQHAHAGNGDVQIAVAIEIHRLHVRRPGDLGQHLFGERPGRGLPDPRDAVGGAVGDDDVGEAVAVQIRRGDVRHQRAIVRADGGPHGEWRQEVDPFADPRRRPAGVDRLGER